MTRRISALLVGLLVLMSLVAPAVDAAPTDAPASFDAASAYLYLPPGPRDGARPAQVLLALHGMGGQGPGFGQGYLEAAERNGWVVVAPTFSYRDWRDPAIVAEDDIALAGSLVDLLDALPARIGRPVASRALVLGFSRGAQLAHRFAQIYPDRTRAAVVLSAGSYTVPSATDARGAPLPFPFGTADLAARSGRAIPPRALEQVPFWVAVGADDNDPADVPRQWDALVGTTRLERAGAFVRLLRAGGLSASLTVFPATGHDMAPAMSRAAVDFLRQVTAPAAPVQPVAPAPVQPAAPPPPPVRRLLVPLAV